MTIDRRMLLSGMMGERFAPLASKFRAIARQTS